MSSRVLIVDDSKVHLSIVSVYLMRLGVELSVADTPEEALSALEREEPDLVVTDMVMPGMNGLELSRKIKERSEGEIAIVLISAARGLDASAAIERGEIDAFVEKPLDGQRLADVVQRLLSRRRTRTSILPAPQVKILVADDSKVGQRLLDRAIGADRSLVVIGVARDGEEAIDQAKQLSPDIVLLDPSMPGMSAEETTRRLVREARSRVVLLADEPGPRATAVYSATAAGAIDIVAKPKWGDLDSPDLIGFHDRLKELAEIPIVRPAGVSRRDSVPPSTRNLPEIRLICICGSTGAPSVLAQLLSDAREAIERVPVLVVQHVLEGFDATFAQWLTETSGARVDLVRDSEPLEAGRVLLAPADQHLVVSGKRAATTTGPPVSSHRPSGTLLFETAAREIGGVAAVVLSGLGDDGADGLREVRAARGFTLVQAPESCAAPSMPQAAIDRRCADQILSPGGIAKMLVDLVRAGERRGGGE